ncbi:hypothetical protein Val02_22180 [Virgisporangium aliadipatigenens]|uniref:Uncharacterized protein n=1 Tax=Virgisporangium aliadipatigenens TaxID=741659 RepID=A0A8J3YJ26_9ACTN|nr:hypothetical protein Val02_22180 [Virgisporangium aliadipatigenens]
METTHLAAGADEAADDERSYTDTTENESQATSSTTGSPATLVSPTIGFAGGEHPTSPNPASTNSTTANLRIAPGWTRRDTAASPSGHNGASNLRRTAAQRRRPPRAAGTLEGWSRSGTIRARPGWNAPRPG